MKHTHIHYLTYLLGAFGMSALMLGCSGDGFDEIPDRGTWTGFIIDARTGEPIDFAEEDSDQDDPSNGVVYALVEGEVVIAEPCTKDEDADEEDVDIDLTGCMKIEDLPTANGFPLVVIRPGYHDFLGRLAITAHVSAENDLARKTASLHQSVRVFPVGVNYNVEIRTIDQEVVGLGVSGVDVRCAFNTTPNFDVVTDADGAGQFMEPENTFAEVVSGTTDTNGLLVIPGDSLVKGAQYTCQATKTDTDGTIWRIQNGVFGQVNRRVNFIVGVSASDINIELEQVPAVL